MKGLKENAYNCKFCGGIPPLGYDVDPATKKYVINNSEASIVIFIYTLYLQGSGYGEIIRELNNRGYTTKVGKKFGKNSIYEILRNEKYTGTYVFNKASKKLNGKFNRHVQKKTDDIIRIENGIPEIIDYGTWRKVQSIMDSRIRPGHKPKEIYLLTGLLRCGICGSAMTSDTRYFKDRNKRYFYYRCYRNNGKNSCSLHTWSRNDLEEAVIDIIEKELFSGNNLEEYIEKISKYYEEHEITLNNDLEKLRFELTGISKKLGNIIEAISNGGNFDSLKEKLASLETQKSQVQIKIEEIENNKRFNIPTKKDIRNYLLKNANLRTLSREELKIYLNEKIRGIRVFSDRIDIDMCVNPIGCGTPYAIKFTIAV